MEVKERNKRWVLKGRLRRLAGGHYVGDRPSKRRPTSSTHPWDKLRGKAPAAAKGPNPLDLPALSATPRPFSVNR